MTRLHSKFILEIAENTEENKAKCLTALKRGSLLPDASHQCLRRVEY